MGALDVQGQFYAAIQQRTSKLEGQAASALKAQTGVDVTNSRVQQGAAAAASLAQGGYDPTNSGDNDKMVAAIAGGLALIPGPGTALAAAVEALYQVGKAVACPAEQMFASIGLSTLPPQCGGQPCTSSGNWTAAGILHSNAGEIPTPAKGSFGQFVLGALATGAASAANCKGAMPPGAIVDAAVNIWNKTHAGPAIPYLVPPLNQTNKGLTAFGSPILITTWGNVGGTANTPATRAHMDPYAMYAFFPVGTTTPDHPAGSLPTKAGPWTPWSVARPPAGQNVEPPRVVMVNVGAVLPPPAPAAPPPHKVLAFRLGTQPSKPAPVKKSSAISPAVAVVGAGVLGVGALAVFKPKLLASLLRSFR